MKVIEHLSQVSSPRISVEIIPPKRGGNIGQLYQAIESVIPFNPPFIDVTSHAAEVIWEEMPDGSFNRRVKPGATFIMQWIYKRRNGRCVD